MAERFNPQLGDVRVTDGDGGEWILRLDVNALCAAEEQLGVGMSEIAERLEGQPSMRDLRALMWAGLQLHQPEVTLQQAGRLFTPEVMGDAIGRAMTAAFGDAGSDGAAEAGKAGPPGAASGSGPTSSPRGAQPDTTRTASGG